MSDMYPAEAGPSVRPEPREGEIAASVMGTGYSPWMRTSAQPTNSTLEPASNITETAPAEQDPTQVRDKIGFFSKLRSEEEKAKRKKEKEQRFQKHQEIERTAGEQENASLERCRFYFYVGCFGLPLLHFVNVAYFMKDLRSASGAFRIRKWIWLSLIIGLVESFLWILWFVVFQLLKDDDLQSVNILRSNLKVFLI